MHLLSVVWRWFLLTLFVATGGCSPAPTGPQLFDVNGFQRLEVLQLRPYGPDGELDIGDGPERFRGWTVVKRVTVKDRSDQAAISTLLARKIAEGDAQGLAATCFEPRHGVIAELDNSSVELVICFACGQVDVFRDGKAENHSISYAPLDALDAALEPAGSASQ